MATTMNASKLNVFFFSLEEENVDICVARHFVALRSYAFDPWAVKEPMFKLHKLTVIYKQNPISK